MAVNRWISATAVGVAALVGGLGLGAYATSTQGYAAADIPAQVASTDSSDIFLSDSADTPLSGPEIIDCKGCGPTLADRQWQADMAAYDAGYMVDDSNDPVVREYERDYERYGSVDPQPSPIHRLPDTIERFARGAESPSNEPDSDASSPAKVMTVATTMDKTAPATPTKLVFADAGGD